MAVTPVQVTPLQSAVGRGRIWFSGEATIPFYLEYDNDSGNIVLKPIGATDRYPAGYLGIRDFNGVPDGLEVETQPPTLSPEHEYNLYNQGWSVQLNNLYYAAAGLYPSNSHVSALGRSGANNDFSGDLARNQNFGNSPAAKGRAILNVLSGDKDILFDPSYSDSFGYPYRSLNFSNAYDEPSTAFFQTIEFFAGRVWLSGDINPKRPSGVYFSQILVKESDAGKFYQQNDPTSDDFSDLLATDGGAIYINNAGRINKLIAFGEGVLVFSLRGVWFIRGDEGGFKATAYSVDKISDAGCDSPFSVVRTDTGVVYWGPAGIYTVTTGSVGSPIVSNITDNLIQQFYRDIPGTSKQEAWGVFDVVERRVNWLYNDDEPTVYTLECLTDPGGPETFVDGCGKTIPIGPIWIQDFFIGTEDLTGHVPEIGDAWVSFGAAENTESVLVQAGHARLDPSVVYDEAFIKSYHQNPTLFPCTNVYIEVDFSFVEDESISFAGLEDDGDPDNGFVHTTLWLIQNSTGLNYKFYPFQKGSAGAADTINVPKSAVMTVRVEYDTECRMYVNSNLVYTDTTSRQGDAFPFLQGIQPWLYLYFSAGQVVGELPSSQGPLYSRLEVGQL